MQRGKWVPIDKRLVSSLPTGKREFTELEAAFCVTCDYDNGNVASVSGYAKQWKWSRKRVSSFAKKMGWSLTTSRSKKVSLIDINRDINDVSVRDSSWKKGASRVASSAQVGDKLGASSGQVGGKLGNGITATYDTGGTSSAQVGDKLGASSGQVGGKLGSSTIDPNPNPNPEPNKTTTAVSCPDNDSGDSEELSKEPVKKKTGAYSEKFLLFWKEYPSGRKQGKKAAWIKWKKLKLDGISEKIMSSLSDHKKWDGWTKENGRFIPMASTWVNGERWEDDIPKVNGTAQFEVNQESPVENWLE